MRLILMIAVCLGALTLGAGCEEKKSTSAGGGNLANTPAAPKR